MMSSDDESSFSVDEIRRQLQALGYENVTEDRLHQFQSDLSRLMSTSGPNSAISGLKHTPAHGPTGDNVSSPKYESYEFFSETTDSSVIDATDATSYNPLPNSNVPREIYVNSDLERTLENLNTSNDLDNFKLKEPEYTSFASDQDSVKTEDLLLYSDKSKVKRMKRKISRKIDYGSESYVTVTESEISDENRSVLSDFSELDSELMERLNKLKRNLHREKKAFRETSNLMSAAGEGYSRPTHVRFAPPRTADSRPRSSDSRPSTADSRPRTAPGRYRTWDGEKGSCNPAFLRPDLRVKQKSSPVDLYHQYRDSWNRHKMPNGQHNELRREIRQMCAERDSDSLAPSGCGRPKSAGRSRRITTDYIVPTTKKRQALLWDVRTALHNREIPK